MGFFVSPPVNVVTAFFFSSSLLLTFDCGFEDDLGGAIGGALEERCIVRTDSV